MLYELILTGLARVGLTGPYLEPVAATAGLLALVLAGGLADRLLRRRLERVFAGLARRSRASWDDALIGHGVLRRLGFLLPLGLLWWLVPEALPDSWAAVVAGVRTVTLVGLIVIGALTLDALIGALRDQYRARQGENRVPTGGVVQLLKIAVYSVAGLLIVSVLIGRTPVFVLSGLGAMTAVLLLIFRDPLLGLMGGVHLTSNDMVRIGDWIEMPKYGADGDVIDISLTSVKVQNFDKTISTIPTYALISDSFKNWRGMSESGGRRIKRAISLDMTSVRFVDQELLARLRRIEILREYLDGKLAEVEAFNRKHGVDGATPINGRRLTNLGTFRAYLIEYLRRHPKIHNDMTFLVRQLEPGAGGIPIEIYVFSNDQEWAGYEDIQAGIFDHVLAAIPEFGLRVFQNPSGADFRSLATATDA